MLNYKVDIDDETQRVIIRWFDEQGNECEPESGTYEVTIPKGTFVWYGDNLSCEGKHENKEYKYTFVVAEKSPKPNIVPIMREGVIHYIIENSAVEENYNLLGYTTNSEDSDNPLKFSSEVGNVHPMQFVSNSNVSTFGYTENKCEYIIGLDESFDFIPNRLYTITLMPNIVYNVGLGEKYNEKKIYNDAVKFSFLGTPQPSLNPISYALSGNGFVVEFDLENYHNAMQSGYITRINNENRPYLINTENTDNAFVKTAEVINGKLVILFACEDAHNFIRTNADGSSAYTFDLVVLENYFLNEANGSTMMGLNGNLPQRHYISIPIVTSVPTPNVKLERRDSDSLTTVWNNAYTANLSTNQQSLPKMYAYMRNGESIDISEHIQITMPNNKSNTLYIDFDSEENFGLNPSEVYNYVLEYPTAMLKNIGDNKVYSGSSESLKYEYAYSPIESTPKLKCVATNVNPFYLIMSGENLTLDNNNETTIIKADAINITDSENKSILMGWEEGQVPQFVNVTAQQEEYRILQSGDSVRLYEENDGTNYSIPLYYMMGNVYEENHKGVIYININGEKVYTDGNGMTTLGKSYATADTISIKKSVVELGLGDTVITKNTMGGVVDWNEEEMGEIPQSMGDNGWGMALANNILPDGTPYKSYSGFMINAYFCNFWFYNTALKYESAFGAREVEDRKAVVDMQMEAEVRGKYIFEQWFYESYLQNNPIEYINGDPNDYSSYSDYPNSISTERWLDILEDYDTYCYDKMFYQKAFIMGIPTNSGDTYTFLFDAPPKHLKLGSRFCSYNGNGEEYALLVTRLLKFDSSEQTDFKYFLYNQNSFYDWSAETDFDGVTDITAMLYQGSNYDYYLSQDGYYFNGFINTNSTMNDVIVATSAFCGNVVAEKYPNSFTFSNLKDGSYMFHENRSLWQIPSNFNPTKLENADYMFYVSSLICCGDIKHYDENGTIIKSAEIEFDYYDQVQERFTNMANENTIRCYHPRDFIMREIPNTWSSVSNIKTAEAMFKNRSNLISVPSNWNFSSLENGESLFNYCSSLQQIPTAWTTTEKLTNGNEMFNYCQSLTTLHDGFKCNNLVNARSMFAHCINLEYLNEEFNPKTLNNAQSMFLGCTKLKQMPSSWTSITNIETSDSMFNGCESLSALPSLWTSCNSTSTNDMFNGCYALKECNIEFTQPKTFNYTYSACTNLKKCARINLGEFSDVIAIPISTCDSLVEFKLDNFGRIENFTSENVINKPDITLDLTFMKVTNIKEEGDEEKLISSFAYVLDHLWTGETIGNQNSIEIRRNDTHQRSACTQTCNIQFYGLTNELCRKVQQTVTTQVGADVIATFLDGAERKWDYLLISAS